MGVTNDFANNESENETKEKQAMKKDNSKRLMLACALGLGMGISVLLPLATNGGEIVKGGPQMMIRSQPYFAATEQKAETKKAVLTVSQSCCSPVACCSAKHSTATGAPKK